MCWKLAKPESDRLSVAMICVTGTRHFMEKICTHNVAGFMSQTGLDHSNRQSGTAAPSQSPFRILMMYESSQS